MILLFIFLQSATLPTNIWTIGGALSTFAGVIIFLFFRYDKSQEKRFDEMKAANEKQYNQLRKDFEEEKELRVKMQEQINGSVSDLLQDATTSLKENTEALKQVVKKL
jgi:hypothetical protein